MRAGHQARDPTVTTCVAADKPSPPCAIPAFRNPWYVHPNSNPKPAGVTCAQSCLAHRAARRWRDRQNGRGPARPAGPVAPRSCRPSQGSRGGRVSSGASGRKDQIGGRWLATPARISSVLVWTRLQVLRVRGGGGACNRMRHTPTGAATVSACGRWGGGGRVRAGGETAVLHRSDRVRSRAGAGPDSRGGNGTNPQPRISSKADWADRTHSCDQMRAWRRPYDQPDRDAGRMPRGAAMKFLNT